MKLTSPHRAFYLGVAGLYAANSLWTTLLLWQMLVVTHSGLWVAMAVAVGAVPTVVVGLTGPDWGVRGRMTLWLAGFAVLLAIAAPEIPHTPWGLLAAALAEGWIDSRLIPKAQAWMMAQASPENAPHVSSRFEFSSRSGMVTGPLLAGAGLTVLGAQGSILLTAFLFMATALAWRHIADPERSASPSHPVRRRDAWHAIRADRFLTTALGVRAGSNLLWPAFTVAIPLMMVHAWHSHALGYGAVRTLWGLSTVAGTVLVIPYLLKHLKASYFLSWVLTGIAFLGIGQSTHLWSVFIWVAAGALSSPVVHVALDSHIGTTVRVQDQSGVFAIQRLVMAVVNLAGLALVSVAIKHVGPGQTLTGAGILMAVAALVGGVLWNRRRAVYAPTISPHR